MITQIKLKDGIKLIIDNRGKTPKKLNGEFVDNGYKVISALNVHNGSIDNQEQIRYVNEELYFKWQQIPIERNDCFIASEGASLGENAIWDSDEKIVLGQRLYALRLNINIIDPWYFALYMQTSLFKEQIFNVSTGSTVFGISQPVLLNIKIFIPDIQTQRKIGILYKNLYRQLKRNDEMVQKLQVLAQAIYTHWFLQFEFPNDEGKPYKSSGGKMIWNDKLKRELPEGWEMKNIKELCDITWGQCPDGNNMRNGLLVDCQAKTNASKRYANKGDVLMSIAGSIGALAIVDEKISLGRAAMAFTPKKCTKLFAYLAIKSLVDRIKQVASGSIQKVINDNHINDMNIPYNEIVFKMFEKYNGIIEEEIILSKENQMLISLRNVLLPLLINNQLQ